MVVALCLCLFCLSVSASVCLCLPVCVPACLSNVSTHNRCQLPVLPLQSCAWWAKAALVKSSKIHKCKMTMFNVDAN